MSLIIPKKPQILYAPMLGSLGGGSVRGFGRGADALGVSIFHAQFSVTERGKDPAGLNHYRANTSVIAGDSAWVNDTAIYDVNSGYHKLLIQGTGTYRLTAYGASQRSNRGGGHGAKIQGDFDLTLGDYIEFVLGQQCDPFTSGIGAAGGGTFVVKYKASRSGLTNNDILVIAGGGGGGHQEGRNNNTDGQATTNGGSNHSYTKDGGINGNGGPHGQPSSGQGGAGFFTGPPGSHNGTEALSYINGATGGSHSSSEGGFGGGGAHGNSHGGGGGGYSGGAGSDPNPHAGGGGGSYNNGTNQNNTRGGSTGHGIFEIELL